MSHVAVCECGWRSERTTAAMAVRAHQLHSCDLHQARAARAARVAARRAADGPSHPCTHGGRHQHGDRVRYTRDRCRCRPCRDAASAYERHRTRQRAYGRPAYVSAARARMHLLHLSRQGMGWKRVALAAGLSPSVVNKLLYGEPRRGRAPSKRIRAATEQKILSVTLQLAGGTRVPAEPTWRLVRGLVAAGYPFTWIAGQIGQGTRCLQLSDRMITKAHADAVRALAERYAHVPGPSARARAYAQARGWTVDLLWDDEGPHFDVSDVDEVAVERACRYERDGFGQIVTVGEPVRLTRAELDVAVARLAGRRLSSSQIARILHTNHGSVRQRLEAS